MGGSLEERSGPWAAAQTRRKEEGRSKLVSDERA
jgi:hypothetical protein